MRRFMIAACTIAVTATLATADAWLAEDFEDVRSIEDSAWTVDDAEGWARVRGLGGPQRLVANFNSRDYSTVRVYLRIQRGTGTVWFDNVDIDGLSIENANFSEHDAHRISGWRQDDVGRNIFWDEKGILGGSVRITQTDPEEMSRVYQNAECEPNTEYRLEVWAASEDLRGTAYAEVYGVNEGGDLGGQLGSTQHIRPPDERTGGHALALHPRSGPVAISREVGDAGDRLATLSADVNTEGLGEGAITLAVVDADTGRVVAESTREVDLQARGFIPMRLGFASPSGSGTEVRVSAVGRGTALIDNITVGDVELTIPPQRVRLGKISEGCAPGVISTDVEDPMLANAIALFEEHIETRTPDRVEVIVSGADVEWPETERYELIADADGVRISAATATGAAHGVMTLLDLAAAGGGRVPECRIVDWPAMPFRGTYRGGVPSGNALADTCRQLMRLKMNSLVMESGVWYNLGDEDVREATREVFDTLRAWGIEPIPEIQSLGHASPQLSRNPHAVEGAWQRDEELTLSGTEPVALEHPNVLRTDATDIVITSADGATTYTEGEDYEVIEGVTDFPYEADAEPYRIRRIAGGGIADGATVLASYDHAVKMGSRNIPYCPSEPAVYEILFPVIESTIRHLEPETLHIGHDEPRIVNSDSRCLKRGMTGGELLAEDITKLNDFAHSVDEGVTLMMWADALNPYHNGTWFSDENEHQLDLVPKDVVQNIWFYGPTQPLTRGRDSFKHFQRYGFTFTGSPWDDPTCCRNWGVVAGEARREGKNCLGLLYTSWGSRWAGLETLAAVAWNPTDATRGDAGG
ncbi:MAG: glycoside hydrolase family 20 zincin-like fold domain-containing protein [Armatimonadota bacterium]